MREYGITVEEYEIQLQRQRGVCAICHKPPKNIRLGVDHNHKTKVNRGLLCYGCNYMLGLVRENTAFLTAAALYLKVDGIWGD